MYKLSVIVPVYNSGEYIYRNLHECLKEFKKYGSNFEIIVVDDGSTDNTWKEANMVSNGRVKVVGYEKNMGKGYALKYGAKYVTGDVVTFMDGDLELPPRNIQKLFPYINGASIVLGSKRHPKSQVEYPFSRRVLSFGYQMMIRMMFGLGVSDTQSGMKLMKKEFLDVVLPKVLVKRFAFDLELLVVGKKYGFKFAEAPIEVKMNMRDSHININAVWSIFVDTLAIAYRLYVLRYYDNENTNA